MATNGLTTHERTELRAQMEEILVDIIADDLAQVENHSYEGDDVWEHTYMVEIDPDTDEPIACSCPSYRYRHRYCKHMAATKRQLLTTDDVVDHMDADADTPAGAETETVADGGPETCPNGQEGCDGPAGDELPCFGCYSDASEEQRTGWD